jgi:two-component system, chemotaxis family, sensor kinase CheA
MISQDAAPHTFVAESRELLRDMEDGLLTLEQSPGEAEAVNAVFRAMHTIKGSAGVFGFDVIVEFTHVMEGVVEEMRAGRISVDQVLVALLLACGDHVSSLIDCLETQDRLARLDAARPGGTDLLEQLRCYCAEAGTPEAGQSASGQVPEAGEPPAVAGPDRVVSDAWHVSVRFSQDVLQHGMDPLSFIRYLSTLGEIVSLAAVFDAMPEAQAMDPEACYMGLEMQLAGTLTRQDIEDAFEYVREDSTIRILPPHSPISEYITLIRDLPEDTARMGQRLVECGALTQGELDLGLQADLSPSPPASESGPTAVTSDRRMGSLDRRRASGTEVPSNERRAADSRYIRVHAGKLDELINLVGELVIASAGVSLGAERAGDSALREATASMSRLVEEVRDGALTLRMVPIGETFSRFNRVVHDLGHELGKDVELVISGAETELDKSMVEKISDPLMHLVRNALDHGIEPPALRVERGKPVRGKLRLNAYHETGSIVIEVHDDGGGLDAGKILACAVELGLAQPGQALSEREIFQLIMEPGFTTTSEVTSVSGRGIGMDVVRRNIEALRGSVTIDSVPGEGTAIALRVPLTLAIIDGFLVGVGAATCVVPLEMVVECLELSAQDRERVREGGYINLRGDVLPLLRLRDVFETQGEPAKRENIVVVQYAGQQAGFVVDALMGEFQTVIKPLGKLFERLAGISGSTILGTGEVALILDVQALVERAVRSETARTTLAGTHRALERH